MRESKEEVHRGYCRLHPFILMDVIIIYEWQFLCDLVFITIGIIAKKIIWLVNSKETRVPGSSGSNGRRRKV